MKKVTLGILCLFTLCLGLFGCSNEKDFVINYDLIKANQEENKVVNKIQTMDVVEPDSFGYSDGYYIFSNDEDDKKAIYSSFAQKIIVDYKENIDYFTLYNEYGPNYLGVKYEEVEIIDDVETVKTYVEILDYTGYVMLPKGLYISYNILCYESRQGYMEKVSYTLEGEFERQEIIYLVDENLNREKVTLSSYIKDKNLSDYAKTQTFEYLGYKDYSYSVVSIGNGDVEMTVYKKNKKYSKYYVPSYLEDQAVGFFDHYLVLQDVTLLEDDSKKYDFIEDGKKYNFTTKTLDIFTGKIKKLKLDIVIDDILPIKDANGKYSFGNVIGMKVKNKNLIEKTSIVINNKFNIVENDFSYNSLSFTLIGDDKLLKDNKLYDKDLNMIFDFNNNDYNVSLVRYNEELDYFVCRDLNGKIGVLNTNLDVIAKFEYDEVYSYDYNETIILRKNNLYYALDKNEKTTLLDVTKEENCYEGIILYKSVYDEEHELYLFTIYNYDGSVFTTFYQENENINFLYIRTTEADDMRVVNCQGFIIKIDDEGNNINQKFIISIVLKG